jgi:hypothetical protein
MTREEQDIDDMFVGFNTEQQPKCVSDEFTEVLTQFDFVLKVNYYQDLLTNAMFFRA